MTSKWFAILAPIRDESDEWLFTKMRVQEDGYPDIAEQWRFFSLTTAGEMRRALRSFGIGVVDLSDSEAESKQLIDLSREDKCAECGHARGFHDDPASTLRWQCGGPTNATVTCRCPGFVEPEKKP